MWHHQLSPLGTLSEHSFRERANPLARERIYRLGDKALEIVDGAHSRSVQYNEFDRIEYFSVRFAGVPGRFRRWIVHPRHGRPVVLTAGLRDRWRVVNRTEHFAAFSRELERRIVARNPSMYFVEGRRLLNRARGIGGWIVVGALRLVRHTGPDRWADVAAWLMRRVGPRTRGHRRALEQLALAFPEKTAEERERIAIGMWDNVGRTMMEYSQLDRIWDYDPDNPGEGRMLVDPEITRLWKAEKTGPAIAWGMHYSNWELAPIAVAKHGWKGIVVYRPVKLAVLNQELDRIRSALGTTTIPAGPSMLVEIRKQLEGRTVLGLTIDQRYVRGTEVTFFGRPTMLHTLCARLARIYECRVLASRVIRIDKRRFRLDVLPLELPRDEAGRIDVQGATQLFASVMERWIREHPEQWLWLQRIWR